MLTCRSNDLASFVSVIGSFGSLENWARVDNGSTLLILLVDDFWSGILVHSVGQASVLCGRIYKWCLLVLLAEDRNHFLIISRGHTLNDIWMHYFWFCLDNHSLLIVSSVVVDHALAGLQVRLWDSLKARLSLIPFDLGIVWSATHLTHLLDVCLCQLGAGSDYLIWILAKIHSFWYHNVQRGLRLIFVVFNQFMIELMARMTNVKVLIHLLGEAEVAQRSCTTIYLTLTDSAANDLVVRSALTNSAWKCLLVPQGLTVFQHACSLWSWIPRIAYITLGLRGLVVALLESLQRADVV